MSEVAARRWRARAALVTSVVMIAVTGCASLPSSGPVVAAANLGDDPGRNLVQVLPQGPEPGATPEQLLRSFVRAGAGFDAEHTVARSFLTASERAAWRPDVSVTLFASEDRLQVKQLTATRWQLSVPVVARIDATGHYTEATPGETQSTTLDLTQVSGQWRIARLEDGIWLTVVDFARFYRPFSLYFPDAGRTVLVPDRRWFPLRASTSTALTRALLGGPSPWLKGAVISAFPPEARLGLDAVSVTNGTAGVDLTDAALQAAPGDRRLMQAQLVTTLIQLPQISSVQITVKGSPLDIPPASGADVLPQPDRGADSLAVLLVGGKLMRLDGVTLTPVAGVAVPDGARSPAVSLDARNSVTYAVVAGGSLVELRPGTAAVTLLQGRAQLTAPSFDRRGYVWTADRPAGAVLAARPDELPIQVSAQWLQGRQVLSFKVSRDGARAAVVSRGQDGTRLDVTGVLRDRDGRPTGLTVPTPLAPGLASVTDVAWLDGGELAALGQAPDEAVPQPYLVEVGGMTTGTAPVPGAVVIAAGAGERNLLVGTDDGRVLTRSGGGWALVTQGRDPAFPG